MSGTKRYSVVYAIVLLSILMNVPLLAADWTFREIIVDNNPPQPSRVTDCTIADINGDGRPDLWFSARKGSRKDEDHFMPWYENIGDMKTWKRHLAFEGSACYGT